MSWIITRKTDGKAMCELFEARSVASINTEKYQIWTALEYLQDLNRRIKAEAP